MKVDYADVFCDGRNILFLLRVSDDGDVDGDNIIQIFFSRLNNQYM